MRWLAGVVVVAGLSAPLSALGADAEAYCPGLAPSSSGYSVCMFKRLLSCEGDSACVHKVGQAKAAAAAKLANASQQVSLDAYAKRVVSPAIPDGLQRRAENYISNRTRDPDAAKFRWASTTVGDDGVALCGYLNAKNGFGGYVGFRPVVALFKDDKFVLWRFAEKASQAKSLIKWCGPA